MTIKQAIEALEATQWGFMHRRCTVCAGWNCGPNGETDYKHTKDCIVPKALAALRSLKPATDAEIYDCDAIETCNVECFYAGVRWSERRIFGE